MSCPEKRNRKKALKPVINRELAHYLIAQFKMSTRRACRTLSLSRTVFFYQQDTRRDDVVIEALTEAAERYPRYGFKNFSGAFTGREMSGTTSECAGFTAS